LHSRVSGLQESVLQLEFQISDFKLQKVQMQIHRVRARNTSADSENKIHDDTTAASFGFKGGLVPGVTIYAYLTVPLVEQFGLDWLERGSMQVKFHQPFYDGDDVLVKAEVDASSEPIKVIVTAMGEDGSARATALAIVNDDSAWLGERRFADNVRLPSIEQRPVPSRELLVPGTALGTLTERLEVPEWSTLDKLNECLPIYTGPTAVAHPFTLLGFANQILVRNYKLGPWIHAASDLKNWSTVHNGEEVSIRGRISDCYERKGHEFVVLDLELAVNDRLVQQVRHTAIYRPRQK
jgi:acyl dehydratase